MSFIRNHSTPRTSSSGTRDSSSRYDPSNSRPRFQREEVQALPVVEVPKVPVDPASRDMVHFKDHYYDIAKMRAQIRSAPRIDVKVDDLHKDCLGLALPSRPLPDDVSEMEPVFAKFEGKYVILLGKRRVVAALTDNKMFLKGSLLSNPTLKKCIVE